MSRKLLSNYMNVMPEAGILPDSLVSCWQSPANIALVKYWGKRPGQIPLTPSLSMTLSTCVTRTRVNALRKDDSQPVLHINHQTDHPYLPKMQALLTWLSVRIPVLSHYRYQVITENSFPTAAGVASSASGLSAFALCLMQVARKALQKNVSQEDFFRDASYVSRMGSGSACRSVYGGWTVWGATPSVMESSDKYARSIDHLIHPLFRSLRDTILIVSGKQKTISSSHGHQTMVCHPYAENRMIQASGHFEMVLEAMAEGDFTRTGLLAENEALSLHALLMTTQEGILLMEPGTLEIIKLIRKARKEGLPVYFTMDAGPNVHLLHPEEASEAVHDFCIRKLIPCCEDGMMIEDRCGTGPRETEILSFIKMTRQ